MWTHRACSPFQNQHNVFQILLPKQLQDLGINLHISAVS
jgi:hypothetical protein